MLGTRLKAWLLIPLFLLSGAASLVYEVIWSRELTLVMGGTTFAITTVLVAFMGGLALGAAIAGRLVEKIKRPQRVYGVLEVLIGLYGLATPWLLDSALPIYRVLYAMTGQSFAMLLLARFIVCVVFLLIPTTMMGATLPLLVQYMAVGRGRVGASVAILYAVNTFGAVLGSAAAGFIVIPWFGLRLSTWLAASLNFIVGALAWALPREFPKPAARADARPQSAGQTATPRPEIDTTTGAGRQLVLWSFCLSGVAAMIYQVAWVRALVMSIGPHTYGFTCILVAYITGIGLGSLVVARWVDRWRHPLFVFALMEIGIAVAVLAAVPVFGDLPNIVLDIVKANSQSFNAVLSREFLVVLGLLLVPTGLMGAIFPLINRLCAPGAERAGKTVGVAYAMNTFGTIVGAVLAGFVLIPAIAVGVRNTILIGVAINAVIGVGLLVASARPRFAARHVVAGVVGVAAIVAVFVVPSWNPLLLSSAAYWGRPNKLETKKLIFYRDGVDATVAVTEQPLVGVGNGDRVARELRINGKVDASNTLTDGFTHVGFPHLAVISAPQPKSMLVIGLGSGISVGSAATHAALERIDCAEISEAVIDAARTCFSEYANNAFTDPRVHIIRADGRNHLLLTDQTYDIILSIPSNPWMAGVSNLFSQEYFTLCKSRLADDGRLCAWLQLYSITEADFKTVVRTICSVFDHVTVWQGGPGDLMLIASRTPQKIDVGRLVAAFDEPAVRRDLARIDYHEPDVLASTLVGGGEPLVRWVGDGVVHTDDNAHLEFSSPLALFVAPDVSIQISDDLFTHARIRMEDVFDAAAGDATAKRVLDDAARGQDAAVLRCRSYLVSWAGKKAAAEAESAAAEARNAEAARKKADAARKTAEAQRKIAEALRTWAEALQMGYRSYQQYPESPQTVVMLKVDYLPSAYQVVRETAANNALSRAFQPIARAMQNVPTPIPAIARTADPAADTQPH